MRKGGFFILVLLLCWGIDVRAQEKLPDTNSPLNKLDAKGKRTGTWWISTPAVRGEPARGELGNYDQGEKVGKWYAIDNEGEIVSVETFKYDMRDGEVRYYTKGVLYCSGMYKLFTQGTDVDSIIVYDPGKDEEYLVGLKPETYSMRHGMWRFYDEISGKLLREEEYQADNLIYKNVIVSPSDSVANKKHVEALPHNKGKYKKRNAPKEVLN